MCGRRASLPALLDVRADELLGVLLQHFVDLVEDRVNVLGELLVPLLDILAGLGVCLLDLVGPPGCLLLTAGVLGRHTVPPWIRGGDPLSLNAILAQLCPAQPSDAVPELTQSAAAGSLCPAGLLRMAVPGDTGYLRWAVPPCRRRSSRRIRPVLLTGELVANA